MSRIGHNVRRVFIGQSDTAVGAVAAELAFDFEEANCVLLIGAGASAGPPSNVPLATSLMLELRRALWKSVLPFVRSHQLPATARESAKAILKEARLERILDALQETHGPEAIHRFLDALDAEQWNQTHALIASLATSGRLPVCITLNFDCLIEKSIQAHGGGVRTECPLKDNAGFETGGDPGRCRLIKPHGSIAPAGFEGGRYSLLAPTLDEIGNHPDPRNVAAIDSSLRGRSLLVLGYSDNDWDIFPILERAADHLRHVYWVQYANKAVVERKLDPAEPSFPRIISWLERCRSRTTLLVGDPAELLRAVCGELLNLTWADIDEEAGHITVSAKRAGRFNVGPKDYPVLAFSCKSHRERRVPLHPEAAKLLQRLKAKSGGSIYPFLSLHRLAILEATEDVTQEIPAAKLVNNMLRAFKAIQVRARAILAKRRGVKLDEVEWRIGNLHDFRKSFGTHMTKHVSMPELQRLMGHASITTTSDFYVDITDDVAEKLRAAFAG